MEESVDHEIIKLMGSQLDERFPTCRNFYLRSPEEQVNVDEETTETPDDLALNLNQFDLSRLPQWPWDEELTSMRAEILLKFNREFYEAFKFVDINKIHQKGNLSNKFYKQRDKIIP